MQEQEIKLSTGKLCPKCGCLSLEEGYSTHTVLFNKSFICVAGCGMNFSLNRLKKGKIKIYYNDVNAKWICERFGIKS